MRLIFILLVILAHVSHGQNLASLLIVSDKNARVLFDGAEIGQILKNKPGKFEVTSGEHYLQVICQCPEMLEKNEILNLEGNVQKVLKFEFGETQPDSHINEISISEIAFSIPGVLSGSTKAPVENPIFYYAFETGDKVILDMKMTNTKGTNNLQVISYPDGQTIFSKSNFQHLNRQSIPIHKRGIYGFSFTTNHAFARDVKLVVQRIPDSKEKLNFNTQVVWKDIYSAETIHQSQNFFINGGAKAEFGNGNSRVYLPIKLPENTVKWYYEFSAERSEEENNKVKQNLSLVSDLSKIFIDGTGTLSFGIDQLTQPPGSDYCDIYLVNHDNLNLFESKQEFRYYTEGTRKNFKSGIVELEFHPNFLIYLGIKNPSTLYGLNVAVEVVAIVKRRELVMLHEQ
ncbi:hypothetical protein [Fulvivirga kasyanovii]|uniref:hypothetical protein n=2 Tax=Fulvivirga kasyanovii TaxID=396812 RepID=UPI0031DD9D7B